MGYRPQQRSLVPKPVELSVGQVLRQPAFWWLAFALSSGTMAAIGIRVHIIPFLEDRNYGPEYAAWIGGLIGAMQVFGRILYAPAGGRYSSALMVALIFGLAGGGTGHFKYSCHRRRAFGPL